MGAFEVCSDELDALAMTSLRFRPKDNKLFDTGLLIAASFEGASEEERNQIHAKITAPLSLKLLGLSGLMAEEAINLHDKKFIRSAVVFHVMEGFRYDYRENYRYLALVLHASKVLDVDLKAVAESVDGIASDHSKRYLGSFLSRDDGLNKIESFGVRESIVSGRVVFIPQKN